MVPAECLSGVMKGTDVYLFFIGMMLLAETAREEKLFDWLAALAVRRAGGSARLLFSLIYVVGIVVTAILSNDATAVVLTPAVITATRVAKVKNPLPYLFICAFIANAASFILPISNPANLVIYRGHMPTLLEWLRQFALPSMVAVILTYIALRYVQRQSLDQAVDSTTPLPALTRGGKAALYGIAGTAMVLLSCSFFNIPLGLPTALAGVMTSLIVIGVTHTKPLVILKGVSWSVLPLVAGLFVIVEALNKTGLTQHLYACLSQCIRHSERGAAWLSGMSSGIACNLVNNLPAGLITSDVLQAGVIPEAVKKSILIGIDLGPNFSVTGSLATILWLVALRRENIQVSAWTFLKVGIAVTLPALILAIASSFI